MIGIEKTIGHSFKKQKLLLSALTHPSYPDSDKIKGLYFQRLEFLGDSIINFFIAFEIYKIYPDANEGILSRLRSMLVSRKILAQIATKLRLKKYLRLGHREKQQFETINEKIMADAYEALVAAIYLDRGQKRVDQFLAKCFRPYLNRKQSFEFYAHPKSILQEYSQKTFGALPHYVTQLDSRKELFQTQVAINKKMKSKGMGRTKQEAEANAAAKLIQKFKKKIFSRKEKTRAN